ncbi:topoisomerase DNA-binding C4 zinc finger domain-containing protein [Aliiglaciecola sp. CAU 1673]|uniref:DNA topoisomerase family protein n=1 Tax=Aliiglaciecola sp. CAU 1673 TaxID=3032595 RepID=UPI0023DAECA5|nr:topoisomerase DNA-binding C4 zinc finger domain-containing protein [Aliiglaciecola sp. CAU 1673]MDF2179758.1 topoisomerase DNA-binding C4 zinc finger domain-containing protein [Aliiglaciecola sp. CAU 1673]
MSKIDHSLFSADEHALQHAYGDCPECSAKLQIRSGRSGPFLGCSRYPECHFSKPLHEFEYTQVKEIEGSQCPQCGAPLAVKKGRFGLFIGCTNFPQCHHIEKLNRPGEALLACPACKKGQLHKRSNRYGKSFYACDQYPDCRYVLNFEPVPQPCPCCGWPLMVSRTSASGPFLQCPQRECQHKVKV